MKTIVKYVGQRPDPTIEDLLAVLAEEPLDRCFEEFGEFLHAPVWLDGKNRNWAPDGSDGEQSAWGNLANYSCTFRVETNDPVVLERLRAAIEANMAMPGYRQQPAPAMSLPLIRTQLDILGVGVGRHDWTPSRSRCVTIKPIDEDDSLCLATMHWDGSAVAYAVDRRKLEREIANIARCRRPSLGFTIEQIVGSLDGATPGTVAHALASIGAPTEPHEDA